MTVRIQLDDGTVREYLVVNPAWGAPSTTRCGEGDCEHPECALELARKMKETARTALIGFSFIVLLGISGVILIDYPFEHGFGSVSSFHVFMILAPLLLLIFSIWYIRSLPGRFGTADRELEEYIRSHTVNGRPARQVHSATAPRK